jgi:hypothetical protein
MIRKQILIIHGFQKLTYLYCVRFLCASCREDDKIAKKFILQPWLENDETEMEFLRKVCEFLLLAVLPKEYAHCHTLRRMLREILTSSGEEL